MREMRAGRWIGRGLAGAMLLVPAMIAGSGGARAQAITSEPLAPLKPAQVNLNTPGVSGASAPIKLAPTPLTPAPLTPAPLTPAPLTPRITAPGPVVQTAPVPAAAPVPVAAPNVASAPAPRPALTAPPAIAQPGGSLLGHSDPGRMAQSEPAPGGGSLLPPSLSGARHQTAASTPTPHKAPTHKSAHKTLVAKAKPKPGAHKSAPHAIAKAKSKPTRPASPVTG